MFYPLRYEPYVLKKRALLLSCLSLWSLNFPSLKASDYSDHVFTTLKQLKISSDFSENQVFHIYESKEGLGTPHNMDSLECDPSEFLNPSQGSGSFCEPKPERGGELVKLPRKFPILGFLITSPVGYWPSAPTLEGCCIDMCDAGTIIISYIKKYRGNHSLFKSNFLAFQAYAEDKKTENGIGFPLAVKGTLKGNNLYFIKNAITLRTSAENGGTY